MEKMEDPWSLLSQKYSIDAIYNFYIWLTKYFVVSWLLIGIIAAVTIYFIDKERAKKLWERIYKSFNRDYVSNYLRVDLMFILFFFLNCIYYYYLKIFAKDPGILTTNGLQGLEAHELDSLYNFLIFYLLLGFLLWVQVIHFLLNSIGERLIQPASPRMYLQIIPLHVNDESEKKDFATEKPFVISLDGKVGYAEEINDPLVCFRWDETNGWRVSSIKKEKAPLVTVWPKGIKGSYFAPKKLNPIYLNCKNTQVNEKETDKEKVGKETGWVTLSDGDVVRWKGHSFMVRYIP
ncbi:MAG: hypothetical protein QW358_00310 [Candidatus Hadarchaeum sp.]